MYHYPGEYITDFCIVKRDDQFHLFHIRGERWTWPLGYKELDLGHATSTDLRQWTPQEPVLPAGPGGAWDECGIWAPDIIEQSGLYHCFYTGSDRNNNQAIGLATSPDLHRWTKYGGNPVVRPGPWSDTAVRRDVAGRDAMVFADDANDRFLMYYTATRTDGRACIALAQSCDLVDWEDLGPTYTEDDRTYNRLESAYLVRREGRYYLFYSAKGGPNSKGFAPSAFDHFDIVYQIADHPTEGWHKPANHELLTEWTCASEHPTFDGVTYMLYIVQEEIDGIWGASILSDPKRIDWTADGTARVREYLPSNVVRESIFSSRTDGYDDWITHGDPWTISNSSEIRAPDGEASLMNTLWGRDVAIEVDVRLRADQLGSLLVRSNPSAMAGYRVSLDAGRAMVSLAKLNPGQPETPLQERPFDFKKETWHKLKIVVQDVFLDVYVDDSLLLVRHIPTYPDGCFGLHAFGAVCFRNFEAVRHVGPETSHQDWERRCRPRHLRPTG